MDTKELVTAIVEGNREEVSRLVQIGLDGGMQAKTILMEGLTPGMSIVGDMFQKGEYFLPEMLFSAKAMNTGLEYLEPLLSKGNEDTIGTVVIGTVQGDMHDIGKNIVGMIMKGAGFNVIDIGVDVPAQKFIDTIIENKADIVAISALLTTTMPAMQNAIEVISEAGLKNEVKIIVGGAPVTGEFAEKIGADGFAVDAPGAASKAKELMS